MKGCDCTNSINYLSHSTYVGCPGSHLQGVSLQTDSTIVTAGRFVLPGNLYSVSQSELELTKRLRQGPLDIFWHANWMNKCANWMEDPP